MSWKSTILDWWSEHPLLDNAPALLCGAAAATTSARLAPMAMIPDFLVGVSALSGLIFAAVTFAAQMMSQTQNAVLVRLVRKHRIMLNRNWTAIMRSAVLCGAAALFLVLVAGPMPRASLSVGVYLLGLVAMRGLRAVHWVGTVNRADEVVERLPRSVPAKPITMPPEHHPRREAS